MSITLSSASLPVFQTALSNLLHCLNKAEANAAARKFDPTVCVTMRLAPDMLPFAAQIRIACDAAKNGTARLAGIEAPKFDDNETTFAELQAAFDYDLPRYLAFGGYPGAVALEHDPDRWYSYMKDAIVEAVIGKDILQSHKVANPALFRQAFQILCAYPAQEISYTKLLGQLQDKGNTDLIKHYIDLYGGAFLLHALQKYSPKAWLARSSSPKMLPACPALFSMAAGVNVLQNAEQRGRAFELAVGAELVQQPGQVFYWRERNDEVDFVYQYRDALYAIEVKSGRKKSAKGLAAFCAQVPQALRVIVTPENFPQFSANPRGFLAQVAV